MNPESEIGATKPAPQEDTALPTIQSPVRMGSFLANLSGVTSNLRYHWGVKVSDISVPYIPYADSLIGAVSTIEEFRFSETGERDPHDQLQKEVTRLCLRLLLEPPESWRKSGYNSKTAAYAVERRAYENLFPLLNPDTRSGDEGVPLLRKLSCWVRPHLPQNIPWDDLYVAAPEIMETALNILFLTAQDSPWSKTALNAIREKDLIKLDQLTGYQVHERDVNALRYLISPDFRHPLYKKDGYSNEDLRHPLSTAANVNGAALKEWYVEQGLFTKRNLAMQITDLEAVLNAVPVYLPIIIHQALEAVPVKPQGFTHTLSWLDRLISIKPSRVARSTSGSETDFAKLSTFRGFSLAQAMRKANWRIYRAGYKPYSDDLEYSSYENAALNQKSLMRSIEKFQEIGRILGEFTQEIRNTHLRSRFVQDAIKLACALMIEVVRPQAGRDQRLASIVQSSFLSILEKGEEYPFLSRFLVPFIEKIGGDFGRQKIIDILKSGPASVANLSLFAPEMGLFATELLGDLLIGSDRDRSDVIEGLRQAIKEADVESFQRITGLQSVSNQDLKLLASIVVESYSMDREDFYRKFKKSSRGLRRYFAMRKYGDKLNDYSIKDLAKNLAGIVTHTPENADELIATIDTLEVFFDFQKVAVSRPLKRELY